MLPKKNRVTKELFKEAMEKGKTFQLPLLSIRYLKGLKYGLPQISVVVSKKNYSKAVDRNKLKRRSRSIVRRILKDSQAGLYILFMKKGSLKAPFIELENSIKEAFQRIR